MLVIEDLPTPLVVNTTCAHTGGQVLLTIGSVCDPLPVGAAAPAQVVLATGLEVPTTRNVTGPVRLITRVTAALSNNLMHARLAAHEGPSRIVLMPPLERRLGLFDAQAMPCLVELGRARLETGGWRG